MNQYAFDRAASTYDKDFTQSNIGIVQRNQVWTYLTKQLEDKKDLKILELNCGSGEDAIRFASLGHKVKATDISEKMLEIGKSKLNGGSQRIEFDQLDINQLNEEKGQYDLVFSNFGGLNCLSPHELNSFMYVLPNLLNEKGRFIAVVMPNFCFSESLYFLLKFNFNKAFRRLNKKGSKAIKINKEMKIWYYGPGKFKAGLKSDLRLKGLRGIGLTVPPSYLEPFFSRHLQLLDLAKNMDERLILFKLTSYISDHYLIDFELRS